MTVGGARSPYGGATAAHGHRLKWCRGLALLGRLVDRGVEGLEIAQELLGRAAPGELQGEVAAGMGGDREGTAGGRGEVFLEEADAEAVDHVQRSRHGEG